MKVKKKIKYVMLVIYLFPVTLFWLVSQFLVTVGEVLKVFGKVAIAKFYAILQDTPNQLELGVLIVACTVVANNVTKQQNDRDNCYQKKKNPNPNQINPKTKQPRGQDIT